MGSFFLNTRTGPGSRGCARNTVCYLIFPIWFPAHDLSGHVFVSFCFFCRFASILLSRLRFFSATGVFRCPFCAPNALSLPDEKTPPLRQPGATEPVIQGFNPHVFFGVALSRKNKRGQYYAPIGRVERREAAVILSQARLIDTKSLLRKVGTLDKDIFDRVYG